MSNRLAKTFCLAAVFVFISSSVFAQLNAQFTTSAPAGCSPLVVNFKDISTGVPTEWKWDLGNNTISFLQNPVATYFNPGQYSIKLIVKNAAGTDSTTKIQYITVYAFPLVNFSSTRLSGCYPLQVNFTNTSTAGSGSITGYLWDFGDGNFSTEANPAHIYTASGNFNVSLQILNSNGCTKTLTRTNYINIANGVRAAFTNSAALSCSAPETIFFQNQSTGSAALTYLWNFGDGGSATIANPPHIYSTAGTYTVQLIVTNNNGCSDTATHISAVNIGSVVANFTLPANICAGTGSTFINTSTPAPDSVAWSFGDATRSAILNPNKIFNAAGNYSIKLVSYLGACRDSVTKNVTVISKPVTAFTANRVISCAAPLTVDFSNTSINAISYQWNFGDGSSSTAITPSHVYVNKGFYTVTLITTNANGCTDTLIKTDYIKIKLPQVVFNNLPQQGCAPFTVTLSSTVNSVEAVTGYLWNFGDGENSTLINPTHTFAEGVFDIQLIITTASGCKDTIMKTAGVRSTYKPVAAFSASPRNVCAFTPVNFIDQTTGTVTQWQWFFGDGDESIQQNPTHSYEDTGLFSIRLIAGNYGCFDTVDVIDYIHVSPPIAKFMIGLNCGLPFERTFTDQSIGADEWFWNFGDGNTSTLASPVHTYAAAGKYSVKLRVKNNASGCEHSKTIEIVIADEQAIFSTSDLEICKGAAATFNAIEKNNGGIANFYWNWGDGTTGTGNPASHVYLQAGIYTVQLITDDAAGCRDTATKINYIKVNGPTADFKPAIPGSCLMTAISFTDLSVSDGTHPLISWNWNYGDGSANTLIAPPFSHAYASEGSYNVSLKITDAAGCTDSIYKSNLLIISTPVAAFTPSDTVSCPQKPILFTSNSTGPGLQYQWNFGDGTTSNLMTASHVYTKDGIYTVQLNITDTYGCTDQVTKLQLIKITTPVANFTVSDSASTCPPLIVQFTNTSLNQSTYNWDFGDGSFSTAVSPSHFYNVAGEFIARLIITGPGGCTSVQTKKIKIRGPKGSFTYNNFKGCKPLTVNFKATTQDRTSFIWDFNDGTTIATKDSLISYTYTKAGIYLPKMILKDIAGCTVAITGKDTIEVSGVKAAFTADTLLLCSNGVVNFTNATLSNDFITGYLWSFGDGSTSALASPSHYYASEGIFIPKLKAFTAMGCIDSFSAPTPVKIVKTPSIGITQSANGCVPLITKFAGTLLNADTAAITWQWLFSDGRKNKGKILNPLLFPIAGTYSITLLATNSTGCKDTANAAIEAYPLPNVNTGADITICQAKGKTVLATGAVSYSWVPATGLSCAGCAAPIATPATDTRYFVTGVSVNGCVNKDSINVSVLHPFKMQHGNGDTLCLGSSATLTASGAASYSWSPTAGLNKSNNATVIAKPAITTNYRLIGTDSIGCFMDTVYFPVKVFPIPTVSAGADITINAGQSTTLTPEISADVVKVNWSPTGSIFRSSYPTIDIKPKETTQYRVEVSNAGACTASDLVTVVVLCNGANVFIPNTFSPNGDGANEIFYPRGTGLFSIKTARVFNRWGELVFEKYNIKANDVIGGWDGSYKGKKLASDVFVYMFEIVCDNNTVLLYKGDIALIR